MDWLKKLPGVGPVVVRLMTTHAWRSYERLDRVKWTRLAAAMTFISFVALFPLLTVAAAIAAATLSTGQQKELEDKIAEQVPGISDQLDIDGLVENAGTVGLDRGRRCCCSPASAGSARCGSVCARSGRMPTRTRAIPSCARSRTPGVLVGLGGAVLVTIAASTVASAAVGWIGAASSASTRTAGGGPAARGRVRRRRPRRLPAPAVRPDPAARRGADRAAGCSSPR